MSPHSVDRPPIALSVGTKFVAGTLALLVVSIVALGFFASRSYEEHLQRSRLAHLENVADMKAERFEVVTEGFQGETRLARDYYNVRRNLPILAGRVGDSTRAQARQMLDEQLAAYREVSGYADFLLTDPEGRVVYVLDPQCAPGILGQSLPDPAGDLLPTAAGGFYVSPVFEDPWVPERFVLMVVSPVRGLAGEAAGLVVLMIDVASMLEPIWSPAGLGRTAQVIVGQRSGGELVCLCPVGSGGEMHLRKMELEDSDVVLPMRDALSGRRGAEILEGGETRYVTAWRPVEGLRLGLVIRVAAEEVFAPAGELRTRIALVSGAVLLAALVGAIALARQLTRPVRSIADAAERIAAGERDVRAEVDSGDEVGRLASRFNEMADALLAVNSSLESRNAELGRLNLELRDLQARIDTHHQALTRAAIVSETDARGRITYANDMFVQISGYTREDLLGRDHRIINSRFHPKAFFQEMWATIGAGRVWTGEISNQAKDGRYYWVDTAIAPVLGDDGKPRAYVAIRFDITARKELESKLLLYREIIANSNDAISILDEQGRYLEQNDAHRRLLGYADVEILGRSPEFYIGKKLFGEIFESLGRTGRYRGEMLNRARDGRLVDVDLSAFTIRNETGDVVRSVGFKRDITERKKTEERVKALNSELRNRVRELDGLNRELEAFSYSVSHDLRAPLRSLDGFSHALLEDYSDRLDDTGRDYLARIRSASQRMGDLIDDMLMLSRVTRREMARESVDLSAIARAVAEELRRERPDRDVEFAIPDGLRAEGDPHLFRILLENLIGNAWKFTGKRERARIELGETWVEGSRAFFVRDDGAGFDMRYARKLFGIFQRLHGHDEFPGTGIGLATVQRIVNRHGGRVWAEGEVGKGATFYFIL